MIITTATGLIFNDEKEILFINHKKFGNWVPPGGKVEANEFPHEACLREIFEETGLKVKLIEDKHCLDEYSAPRPFAVTCWERDKVRYIDYLYICKYTGGEVKLEEKEAYGFKWVSEKAISKIDTFSNIANNIKSFFKSSENW
ncbi:MAG: NUDIX hydrolase [Defluviitaleaceae bacterium]|nr:NUDIX hydrolase [Defluviitaleaceae bacterium]